jgi:cytochrome b561
MTGSAAPGRYSGVAMVLHWLTALLVIGNLVGGHLIETFEDAADPALRAFGPVLERLHISFGVTILVLTLARLGWRLANPPPPLPGYMTPLERWLAGGVHVIFYLLLFILPLSGWAMLSTGRVPQPLSWFGLVTLPPLPLPGGLRGLFHEAHELLGWAMVALIALHVGAALKHRVFDRDDLLARMLPRR